MKSMKKLIFSATLLTLAFFVMLGTTYAWFSASQNARAEGLQLTATVPNNLQIRTDDQGSWGDTAEFASGVTEMMPVSSVWGENDTFFWISSVAGNVVGEDNVPTATNVSSGKVGESSSYYYFDIPVYLKLTGEADSAQVEVSSAVFSAATGSSAPLADAYRIAIFNDTAEFSNLVYFGGNSIKEANSEENGYKVFPYDSVNSLSGSFSVLTKSTIELNGTEQVALIVRIWLEGQDPNCVNANATDTVKLTLTFASAS